MITSGFFCHQLHGQQVQRRIADKLCTSIHALPGGFGVYNRPCAQNHFGNFLHQIANHFDCAGNRHGHFDNRNPAVGNLFRAETRIVRGGRPDNRHDTNLFYPGTEFLFFHFDFAPERSPAR